MITIINITIGLTLLFVPNAQSFCSTHGPACHVPEAGLIIIDSNIKPEFLPFTFLHEYGHYLYGESEDQANNFVFQFMKTYPNSVKIPNSVNDLLKN